MNAADEAFFARRSARTSQTSTKAGATDTSDSPNAESGSKHKARRSLGRRTDPDEATRRRNRVKKTQNDRSRKIDESLSSLASFRKSMARKTSRVREARAAGAAEAGGGAQEGGKADKERRKKKKHKSPVVLTSPFAERGFPTILRGKASLTPSPGTVDRISRAKSGAVSQTFDSWMQKKKKKTKEKKGAVGMEKKKKRKHDDVRRSGSGSSSSSSPASPASVSSSSSSRSRSRRKKTKEKEKEEQKKKRTTRSKLRETHEKLTSKTKPKSKVTVKIMRTSASPKRSTSPNVSQQRHGLPKSYMDDLAEMKVTKLSFSDDDDDDMPLRGGAKPGLKRTQTIAKARTPTPKKAGERRGQKSAGSGSGGSSSSSRSPVRKAVAFSDLSKDQQRVYRMTIDSRKNVLMLGEGGTGKTELIKLITKKCKGLRIKVEVTASTGKAALLIGGSTLHSFAGVKKGYGSVAELLALVRGNRYCRTRWRNTKLLILDEVSMISAELLYKLDRIARAIRPGGAKKPFGGMQILASGDFLQLPPVKADYCFKHECFDQLFPVGQRIVLTHNFRQDKDPQFREVLQAIRWGNVTVSADCLMRSRVGVLPPDDQPASIIFPLRRQVDELNKEKMAELTSKVRTFKYEFFSLPKCSAKQADYFHNLLLESTPISRGEKFHGTKRGVLELKVGARVMHTCNNKETGKVNGSLGTVVGFEAVTGNPVVKWADGTQHAVERHTWATNCQKATLVQYPLIVAWAITVHKAQGATLDAAIIDLGPSIFEYNQAYTAASRVRRLQDLYLLNWQRGVARPHYEALKFYADLGVALAQKSIAIGAAKADFEQRQKSRADYEARVAAAAADSAKGGDTAFSQHFSQQKRRSPSPTQEEMDEAMDDFGVTVQRGDSEGGGGGGEKKRARTTEKKKSFVEHKFLMFTEFNGWEGEKWFRYFAGDDVDVDAVAARLNKLNKNTATGTGRNSKTRFSIEPVTATTVAMSKMDDEMGCVKIHKVFAKALDQTKLTSGTDDELFDRLYKCGVEGCVKR